MKSTACCLLAIAMAAIVLFLSASAAQAIPSLSVMTGDMRAAKSLAMRMERNKIIQAFIMQNNESWQARKTKIGKCHISVKRLLIKLVTGQSQDRRLIMGGSTTCPM